MSIKRYSNFFNQEEIQTLLHESFYIFSNKESKYFTNFTRWQPEIIKDSGVVLMYPLTNDLKSFSIINNKFKTSPDGISFYYWTSKSYIPWHDDEGRSKACTLYLNKEWDKNWGGYFLAEDKESNTIAIKPEYNLLIEQTGNLWHSTTPTTSFAPIRATVQMFWN